MCLPAILSCEDINCTLNNVVLCHFTFYDSNTGKTFRLADTLTVTAAGTDSILFNRGLNTASVSLPMSFYKDADTLNFIVDTKNDTYKNTIIINKESRQHFESPDCPATMFHTIKSASVNGVSVDSVVVSRKSVNYKQDENIKVYMRTDLD